VKHDLSKTQDPELAVFNEYTPKLKDSTYGSDEYKGYLAAMGEGLRHHYAANRHHPEHFTDGVDGMTLSTWSRCWPTGRPRPSGTPTATSQESRRPSGSGSASAISLSGSCQHRRAVRLDRKER
jgi:hypothetical protein